MNFVVFVASANPEIPTNPVLLPRALAGTGAGVLMVEVRDRSTARTLQPWRWGELALDRHPTGVWVLQYTPALPSRLAITAGLARKQMRRAVRRAMERAWGGEPAYHLIFSPNEAQFRRAVADLPMIYRVIDDYPTMPFYSADPEGCRRTDERLCREALAVVASNPKLLDRRRQFNPNHLLLPNAVNYDHFARTELAVPEDLARIPPPRIGFAGAVDAYKMDFGLLKSVAELRPDWSFVLVGKVGTVDATSEETLPVADNIRYLGFRAYAELPAYVAGFAAGIIPYVVNEYTAGVSPLKLYEYLAAGIPVVSTPLPFAAEAGPLVRTASGAEEFARALEAALAEEGKETERREAARRNSWQVRAEELLAYLRQLGMA